MLEDVIWLRPYPTQKLFVLLINNGVIQLGIVVVEIFMESATVLSPHGTVGHKGKAPAYIHPKQQQHISKVWSAVDRPHTYRR